MFESMWHHGINAFVWKDLTWELLPKWRRTICELALFWGRLYVDQRSITISFQQVNSVVEQIFQCFQHAYTNPQNLTTISQYPQYCSQQRGNWKTQLQSWGFYQTQQKGSSFCHFSVIWEAELHHTFRTLQQIHALATFFLSASLKGGIKVSPS